MVLKNNHADMSGANPKWLAPLNVLLALLAVFTLTLTFYICTKFYTYLPTSDTWIYSDFLAQAAQGHLDTSTLFAKHNHVHQIALPKLVYFLDAWVLDGSGALTTIISLLAMLATAGIFLVVIKRIRTINGAEKIFLSLGSVILLLSACQAESLLNPANLQWSLLVLAATLTAWFVYRAAQQKLATNIAGIAVGMVLATLTSASSLLILAPLGLLLLGKQKALRLLLALAALVVLALIIGELFFFDHQALIIELFKNMLKFTADFLAPPVERLHSLTATLLSNALFIFALWSLAKKPQDDSVSENIFFGFLLYFALAVILATGLARSYTALAFTFRFVNLGLLFAAALLPLFYLQAVYLQGVYLQTAFLRSVIMLVAVVYVALLSYINVTEASAFAFGRNHIRLTQVAHALDINDPFVIASMPGTVWQKDDFDYVQAHKHKLREAHTGIYASAVYQSVGKDITTLPERRNAVCTSNIIKMRQLLPNQASWRLIGESKTAAGESLSQAWFVDNNNIIRGFAIAVEPGKNLLANLRADKQWAGFFNQEAIQLNTDVLAANVGEKALTLYAYNDNVICQGEKITLPDYRDLRKKSARSESQQNEE